MNIHLTNRFFPRGSAFGKKGINTLTRVVAHHVLGHDIACKIVGVGQRHLPLQMKHGLAISNRRRAFAQNFLHFCSHRVIQFRVIYYTADQPQSNAVSASITLPVSNMSKARFAEMLREIATAGVEQNRSTLLRIMCLIYPDGLRKEKRRHFDCFAAKHLGSIDKFSYTLRKYQKLRMTNLNTGRYRISNKIIFMCTRMNF